MRIAASSIAWPVESDRAAARALAGVGARGVELAPTRQWSDLSSWDAVEADAYRALWEDHGLEIVAMQSLLYGRPDLQILGTVDDRARALDYLAHAIDLAARWEAPVLVFGSPKNRRAGSLDPAEAWDRAEAFFRALADRAAGAGCAIGLEANPEPYACDFLTRSSEAVAFVESLAHPGLVCHLDLGGMILASEDPAEEVRRPGVLRHVHASEPFLEGLGAHMDAHEAAAGALRARGYDAWVSLEMRADADDPIGALRGALVRTAAVYGSEGVEVEES